MTGEDILADMGHLFLGSRLKRLAERFQAGAAKAFRDAGHDTQPGQMPLLAALDRFGPLTVGGLVDVIGVSQPAVTRNLNGLVLLGLVETSISRGDRRQKTASLTAAGVKFVREGKASLWPRIDGAVAAMCAPLSGPLLGQIAALEAALAAAPLDARAASPAGVPGLELVEFSDALAGDFKRINAEWITAMYTMEPTDHDVLDNPRDRIVDPGGAILFARTSDLGIVGACALQAHAPGVFELTKMGVSASARGRKVGEFLLAGTIARARALRAETLFLLTNRKSAAAIHLYEKLGFAHDADIMERYGRKYARCDVAMRYPI